MSHLDAELYRNSTTPKAGLALAIDVLRRLLLRPSTMLGTYHGSGISFSPSFEMSARKLRFCMAMPRGPRKLRA